MLSTVVKYITRSTTGLDITQITEHLYLSTWINELYVNEIQSLDVRLILSMHWRRPVKSLERAPANLLWLPTIDSPQSIQGEGEIWGTTPISKKVIPGALRVLVPDSKI
jgi:hypothetical protein